MFLQLFTVLGLRIDRKVNSSVTYNRVHGAVLDSTTSRVYLPHDRFNTTVDLINQLQDYPQMSIQACFRLQSYALLDVCHTASQTSPPLPARVAEICVSTKQTSHGHKRKSSPRRSLIIKLVERLTLGMHRRTISSISSHQDTVEGCFYAWVGSTSGSSSNQRPIDS